MSEGSRDSCGNHSNIKISDTHTHTHTIPGGCHGGGGGSGVKNPGNVKLPIAVICFNPPNPPWGNAIYYYPERPHCKCPR